MKQILLIPICLISLMMFSCSGSDTYRGDWKATDMSGEHYQINFEAKKFSITDPLGEKTEFGYTQNSVNISNSVETYGIKVDDGRSYEINFPIANDESRGTMADGNGYIIYTICRDKYIEYDELFSLL